MMDLFKNKTIVILGGTGFLGHALIEEILKCNPRSIRVFSRDEFKHHKTQEKFGEHKDEKGNFIVRNMVGDVRDYPRLLKATKGADIVVHAAALKRIDMIEYNVEESIKTNVIASLNVTRACLENNVETVVFISSDKACSPVNTYGACKFVSERIFIESNYSKGDASTKFVVVRYGNVLESTGSVIPFFMEKIRNNMKIPLTEPEMTRFIIFPKQAVDLVFTAIKYGVGGEVFIPKLPAMKLQDLIEILKEKTNHQGEIDVIGLRPGEKIHELMINESEIPRTYEFKGMFVIIPFLEKHQPWTMAIKEEGIYKNSKIPLTLKEYNSKDALISKEELRILLDPLIKLP